MQPRDPITGRFVRDPKLVKAAEEQAAFSDPRPAFEDWCGNGPDAIIIAMVLCALVVAVIVGCLVKGYFGF